MKGEKVVLVNKKDEEIGLEEKLKAHKKALLHRAFSIFIFNFKGDMLLQKRAKEKYHCGSLWTNTCCSHPRQKEATDKAAHRRLKEEMGFDCELLEIFTFHYKAKFENGLKENEIDHVFIGFYDKNPKINKKEADDYRWVSIKTLENEIKKNPERFTPWLKIAMKEFNKLILTFR
jgi:isopentenyl-diphosphate Delta-isomerase